MRFSAGEAAFEGFRVTRHHPAAVAVWALISLVSIIAMVLTAMPILQPVAAELQTMLEAATSGGRNEPSQAMQMQMMYATWATMPVSLVSQAILLPAIYRAMRSEGRDRFAFVRLGRDELRVLAVLTIVALISLILNMIGQAATTFSEGASYAPIGALVSFIASLFGIFVAVRLVLATPAAFDNQAIDVKAAWRLTKPVFWPLFGIAIIAGVMAAFVLLLLVIVALPIWALVGGTATVSAAGAAASVVLLFLMGLGATLVTTIVSAPFMAAYREMTGEKTDA